MTKALTADKLADFAKAVEQAAHKHLGENGISSIAIGLNRDVYYESRINVMMQPGFVSRLDLVTANKDVLPFYSNFVCIVEANSFGELTERLKK